AGRLRHLFSVLEHERGVHEESSERLSIESERDLVLGMVVRIDEVQAAAVKVDRDPEDLTSHGVAFEVPAGGASAPRALPGGRRRVLPLPDHELAHRSFPPGEGVLGFVLRMTSEFRVGREILARWSLRWRVDPNIPLAPDPSGLRERFRHPNNLGDERARPRAPVGREYPEGGHVAEEPRLLAAREGAPGEAQLPGSMVDLVLEVRHVHHVADRRSLAGEESTDEVE